VKLFAGLNTTDYQDILRAIGAFIDQQRLRDVRIIEHEDGMIIQGRTLDDNTAPYEELTQLLRGLYRRRTG
jgi:hypothetical protein